jgi:hypothetical protein
LNIQLANKKPSDRRCDPMALQMTRAELSPRLLRLERFRFSSNRENALSFCFHAIPDGKTLNTFPGIALNVDLSGCRGCSEFPSRAGRRGSRGRRRCRPA